MRDHLRQLCVSVEERELFRAAAERRKAPTLAAWVRELLEAARTRFPLLVMDPRAKASYVARPVRLVFTCTEAEGLSYDRAASKLHAPWSFWARSVLLRDCASLGLTPTEQRVPPPPVPRRRDRVHKTVRFREEELDAHDRAWRAEGFPSWSQWILRIALDEAAEPLLPAYEGAPLMPATVAAVSASRQFTLTLSQWTRCDAAWRAAGYPTFSSWLRDAAHAALSDT